MISNLSFASRQPRMVPDAHFTQMQSLLDSHFPAQAKKLLEGETPRIKPQADADICDFQFPGLGEAIKESTQKAAKSAGGVILIGPSGTGKTSLSELTKDLPALKIDESAPSVFPPFNISPAMARVITNQERYRPCYIDDSVFTNPPKLEFVAKLDPKLEENLKAWKDRISSPIEVGKNAVVAKPDIIESTRTIDPSKFAQDGGQK